MASPSARTGLLLGSTNDIRLAPQACSTAPKRPRIDVSLAQRGPWSPGRHVPRKVAILLPREVGILSPLGYIPKWPFGAFAMQSRCPTHPARPPSHVGGPHCAPRPSFCDVGWLPRYTTARVPPCPTRLHPWDHGCKLFALAPTGHGLRRRATASPLTCQTGPRAVGRPVVPQISMVGTVAGEQKLRPVLLEEAYQPTDTYRFHSTIHRRAAEKMFPEEAARGAAKFDLSP